MSLAKQKPDGLELSGRSFKVQDYRITGFRLLAGVEAAPALLSSIQRKQPHRPDEHQHLADFLIGERRLGERTDQKYN